MPLSSQFNVFRHDPGYRILLMSVKVLVTLLLFLGITTWLLPQPFMARLWSLYYLAFAAISCAHGDIRFRRQILLRYTIGFIGVMVLITVISSYHFLSLGIMLIMVFVAYWIRRFGSMYHYFPPFLTLMFLIGLMQITVTWSTLGNVLISTAIAGALYYGLVLGIMPWDTSRQLTTVARRYSRKIIRSAVSRSINIQAATLYSANYQHHLQHAWRQLLEDIELLHDKCRPWIARSERRELWRHICSLLEMYVRISYQQRCLLIELLPRIGEGLMRDYNQDYHYLYALVTDSGGNAPAVPGHNHSVTIAEAANHDFAHYCKVADYLYYRQKRLHLIELLSDRIKQISGGAHGRA